MTFSNCKRKQQSCQSQLYNMDNINMLCGHNNKICHDVKKYFTTSKTTSWRQKVCHDVKKLVHHGVAKLFMTSKSLSLCQIYVTTPKSSSGSQTVHHECQKYVTTSKSLSWCKKYVTMSKSSSWRQKVCPDDKKYGMMWKCYWTMLCHLKVITDRHTGRRQPLRGSTPQTFGSQKNIQMYTKMTHKIYICTIP